MCAPDLVAAVRGSSVLAVCIDDYANTMSMFEEFRLEQHSRDHILIQFSTGTPQEARDSEAGAISHGTNYLDGALLAYPRGIGHDGLVAISGAEETHRAVRDVLSSDVCYLGPAVGATAALDLASLTFTMSTHLGLIHAALLCESEQVPYEQLATVVVDSQTSDAVEITHLGPVHLNIGNNPNALLTQSQEWERVYGSITCGMGDFSLLGGLIPGIDPNILNKSTVHWDWTVLHPKILLDDKVFAEKGRIYAD